MPVKFCMITKRRESGCGNYFHSKGNSYQNFTPLCVQLHLSVRSQQLRLSERRFIFASPWTKIRLAGLLKQIPNSVLQ